LDIIVPKQYLQQISLTAGDMPYFYTV